MDYKFMTSKRLLCRCPEGGAVSHGLLESVNTSKWAQVNTSEYKRTQAAWPLGKCEHKQLLHQNFRALATLHLQQTINPMFLLFLSIITSYIALKEAKQSRQTQGSPTGLQHDANVASRHDRSARLMVLDHWSIPLYPCTPLCYICWSVPLYPTIADLHLTAHVE